MKKIFILIFMIYIILLQFTLEVNTQASGDVTPAFSGYIAKTRTVTEQTTKTANASAVASTVTSEVANSMMVASIVGGIVGGLILAFLVSLGIFLVKMYKNKKEKSQLIATPELNNVNRNIISNPGIMRDELYNEPTLTISNQGQEFAPNSPNYGTTRELGNNYR
jgi:hypothetical protein